MQAGEIYHQCLAWMNLAQSRPARGRCRTALSAGSLGSSNAQVSCRPIWCDAASEERVCARTVMSKAVPLRTALRVEMDCIVILGHGGAINDAVLELLPAEGRVGRLVQGPVQGYTLALSDLCSCCRYSLGSDQVQSPELVILSPEAPSVAGGTRFVQRQGFEGR
jgi:hypothetical protein